MLVRLQFIIRLAPHSTCVAWPRQTKEGHRFLTHNPLESIGYGSEEVALLDMPHWEEAFPQIEQMETTTFCGDSK